MTILRYILFGLILLMVAACSRHPIPLGIVRHLPVYFHNSMLFGESTKLMEEKNEFLVATGSIDTTDEYPPIKVAFVSIDNRLMQFSYIESTKNGDETSNAYFANGYTLLVSYTIHKEEGDKYTYENVHIRIGNKNRHSEYKVFGMRGYL